MTSMRWLWFLPITLESVRVTNAGVALGPNTMSRRIIEGKVTRCTVGDNVVFEKAEDASAFPASLEYADGKGAGEPGWVINIPNVLHLEVDSEKMIVAEMGLPFMPKSYTVFISEEGDPSGAEMKKSLRGDDRNWIQQFAIVRVSASKIKITAIMKRQRKFPRKNNVEIEFTGTGPVPAVLEPRQDLPAWEYDMPMQGKIIRLKVDGNTVFDRGFSNVEFSVVGTPTFLHLGRAQGLSVDVVGFTQFTMSKREMERNKYFTPNHHGFTELDGRDNLNTEMFKGLVRWKHITVSDIDISAKLTFKTNKNSVQISGNGTELIFSKDIVEGKVVKCTVDGTAVFEQEETNSVFKAVWGYIDDGPQNFLTGWSIMIPGIVRFNIGTESFMASTSTTEVRFVPSHYTVFHTDQIDESGAAMKSVFANDQVDWVSIKWDSHKLIKIGAQMTDKTMVDIEFTRGPTTANAGDYGME